MKTWLVCIISVSVFSGLTDILIPDGKSKKTFKAVSAIVLLCALLYPLKNTDINSFSNIFSSGNEKASSSFQENHDEAVIAAYESGIKNVLAGQLSDFDISSDNISVDCTTNADKIAVKKIKVLVEGKDEMRNEKIKAAIIECLNEEPEIEIISR